MVAVCNLGGCAAGADDGGVVVDVVAVVPLVILGGVVAAAAAAAVVLAGDGAAVMLLLFCSVSFFEYRARDPSTSGYLELKSYRTHTIQTYLPEQGFVAECYCR